MIRIKIKDLPEDMKVSRKEMRKIRGGYTSPELLTEALVAEKMEVFQSPIYDVLGAKKEAMKTIAEAAEDEESFIIKSLTS